MIGSKFERQALIKTSPSKGPTAEHNIVVVPQATEQGMPRVGQQLGPSALLSSRVSRARLLPLPDPRGRLERQPPSPMDLVQESLENLGLPSLSRRSHSGDAGLSPNCPKSTPLKSIHYRSASRWTGQLKPATHQNHHMLESTNRAERCPNQPPTL